MGLIHSLRHLFRVRHVHVGDPAPRQKPGTPTSTPTSTPSTTPSTPAGRAHVGESGFDQPMRVNVASAEGYTAAESQKLQQATALLSRVLGSAEFRQRVLDYSRRAGPGFADNDGLQNAQVLEKLLAASEDFASDPDGEVDLHLEIRDLGWFQRHTVGYTYPNKPLITQNRRFFAQSSAAEVAGNLAHEWVHKLGFGHDKRATAQRPDSVPYAVGRIVEELARKLEG